MGCFIRAMNVDDIAQVSEIDREAFPTEWPPPSFKRELSSSMVRYLVAVDESRPVSDSDGGAVPNPNGFWKALVSRLRRMFGKNEAASKEAISQSTQVIVGYASLWMMGDESHLMSIAVRRSHRRRGIGELLLLSIIKLSLQMKARVVTLEVRASNHAAQALYAKYGFKSVGIRRRYYSDNGEDAVIMTTDRITSAAYQAKLQELETRCAERYRYTIPMSTLSK